MLRQLRRSAEDEEGFTLLELLVVVLMIGILAAIAIPSFLGQRDKAGDAAARSQARTAQIAMETCATDHGGAYAGCAKADLIAIEPTLGDSSSSDFAVTNVEDETYTITATSGRTTHSFVVDRLADGTVTHAGSGDW